QAFALPGSLVERKQQHAEPRRVDEFHPVQWKQVGASPAYNETECRLVISDQGKGFDWRKYVNGEFDGRSLNSRFDSIQFNPADNDVPWGVCYSRRPVPDDAAMNTA